MKIPEKYRKRLMGLIPVERIVTWQVRRPPKELIQELLGYEGLTPTLSDILDSLGVAGAISDHLGGSWIDDLGPSSRM